MAAPSTFFSLPHCHAVLHCRTRTNAVVASAISICLHSFFIPPSVFRKSDSNIVYLDGVVPPSSARPPPSASQGRPQQLQLPKSASAGGRQRSPDVARGHQRLLKTIREDDGESR